MTVVAGPGPELRQDPEDKEGSIPKETSKVIKYASLVALTLFNSSSTLCLRYSQIRDGEKFMSSTVVVMTEVVKLTISLFLVYACGNITEAYRNLVKKPLDSLKICLPSVLYMFHNNLLYVGAQHLDAVSFLITCRLKVLMTAVFAFFILKQSFRPLQIVALVLLIVGVVLVQLAQATETTVVAVTQNRAIGFAALVTSSVFSAFSGIYLEKIFKSTNTSLWIRNVQLSSISLIMALITCLGYNWTPVMDKGFFFGYDWFVLCIILMQAGGGLTVAVVIKYADNILKCLITSLTIVIVGLISIFIFGLQFSWMFAGGVAIVITSVFMYNHQQFVDKAVSDDNGDSASEVTNVDAGANTDKM